MTVPKKEQNAGVALLLERMKTNPEEFYAENEMRMGQGKWVKLWELYGKYLSEEDRQAYINGLKEINQQRFTECVMEGLVNPYEKDNLAKLLEEKRRVGAIPPGMFSDAPIKAEGVGVVYDSSIDKWVRAK